MFPRYIPFIFLYSILFSFRNTLSLWTDCTQNKNFRVLRPQIEVPLIVTPSPPPPPSPLIYVKHNAVHMLCEGCHVFTFTSISAIGTARLMRGEGGEGGEVHRKGKQTA